MKISRFLQIEELLAVSLFWSGLAQVSTQFSFMDVCHRDNGIEGRGQLSPKLAVLLLPLTTHIYLR